MIVMLLVLSIERFRASTPMSGVDEPSAQTMRSAVVIISVVLALSSPSLLGVGLGLLATHRVAR
jgi:hypothetical protein